MPWTTTRAFFVKRTAKSGASRRQLDRKFRGLLDGLRGLAADGPENLLRRGFVYAFDACDDRDGRMHLVESLVQACIFGMPVFRVVVDYELRIPRDDASLVRHHEGVDLDELGVLFPEEIVGMADDRGDLFTDVLVQGEAPQEGPDHVRLEAEH